MMSKKNLKRIQNRIGYLTRKISEDCNGCCYTTVRDQMVDEINFLLKLVTEEPKK